jgi:hypothetical protein
MTDPVRSVAPREDELEALKRAHALLNKHQIDWLTHHGVEQTDEYLAWMAERKNVLRLIENTLRLAAAPVPCAASPADQTWEQRARQHLWLNHGCAFRDGIYGDDGEMQCNNTARHRPLDFKRESWDALSDEIFRAQLARATGEGARDGNTEHGSRTTDRSDHAGNSGAHQARTATAGESSLQPRVVEGAGDSDESAPVAVSLDLREALAAFIDVYDVVFSRASEARPPSEWENHS